MGFTHDGSTEELADPRHLPSPPGIEGLGISSRFVDTSPHSLVFHILECVPKRKQKTPKGLVLLVHGFPDVAYSWRKVLPRLAAEGYHAVAYDTRGFGRTSSVTPMSSESFRPVNLLLDALALTSALGYESVSCIVGHDFGAVTATLCGLARPDVFRSVVLMSHPVKGPMNLPYKTSPSYGDVPQPSNVSEKRDLHAALAQLDPPRQHYQRYYCSASANDEMSSPGGDDLHTFLRGYFYLKSADWKGNHPIRLKSNTAEELAGMPSYYIMPLGKTMRATVADAMKSEDIAIVQMQAEKWLNNEELSYYTAEWERTTFRGGLNWYRLVTDINLLADFFVWSRLNLSVPTTFVAGNKDWGSFQDPGALEQLEKEIFVEPGKYKGTIMIEEAGHWVNQEQPERCVDAILKFLSDAAPAE
ncbi:uncharacterized protein PV06_10728 [Exophiala oligosperma]|uniref:AB hydrolase-1 domain-containing protein n=1 Tax=Exophiala oligosperma TaxID=215243 RepID=A0A0D2A9S6_9EURO|nr:uncharacterized protein PV06_10728 [Exophiala oligosperma]KIW37101.1 hypothetical protein PV06_10728 [Exophiala oligosperma]